LSDEERESLLAIVRSPTSEQRMVTRARVVLAAAEGKPNRQIAREVGLSERKVGVWRNRFAERRIDGLGDLPRPGKPRVYDHDKRVEVFQDRVF
jgi:transposase